MELQTLRALAATKKVNAFENLRQLQNEHWDIVEPYLTRVLQLHKSIPLSGLDFNTIIEVATRIYYLTTEQQVFLGRQLQSFEMPLNNSFIQLRPDRSTSFERKASRRMLTGSIMYVNPKNAPRSGVNTSWSTLVKAPYMPSMAERDRFDQSETKYQSVQDILRRQRWIVILGDPGSGKTSFVRWLVTQLSKTLLSGLKIETSVRIVRMPILIRIGEFAEALAATPKLSLFEYIGRHEWMGKPIIPSSIDKEQLTFVLQNFIKEGHTIIILDGLDEIANSDQRIRIVNLVENFVESHVKTPYLESAFDQQHSKHSQDDPSESGGNQLIITSRIVGYHAAPLGGRFAHYIIKPMDLKSIKEFVDFWFGTVHEQILLQLNMEVENKSYIQANVLKDELGDKNKRRLWTTRRLLTAQPTHFTVRQTVESMLSTWSSKGSTIHIPKLIRILCDIASFIHRESPSGLIHEEPMKNICIESIKTFTGKKSYSSEELDAIEEQAEAFVRIIREDVGIIAARGQSLYGFLHLTFQEYFTCLKLTNIESVQRESTFVERSTSRVSAVAQSLRRHMIDPHFRIPLFLGLGRISSEWSAADFDALCTEFIKENSVANSPLPIGAYLMITSTNDLVHQPSVEVYITALNQLMLAAGVHKWSVIFPLLLDQIVLILRKLPTATIAEWISDLLSPSTSQTIESVSALCYILERELDSADHFKWIGQTVCEKLVRYLKFDSEENNFAVDRFLLKMAFRNHKLLPNYSTGLKGFLISEDINASTIHPSILSVLICVYGGIDRTSNILFDPAYIHRESPILTPLLVCYFTSTTKQTHQEKIGKLVADCERTLISLISNDSVFEAIDVVVAILCLVGIEYIWQSRENITANIWLKVLDRMKHLSTMLRHLYFPRTVLDGKVEDGINKVLLSTLQHYMEKENALSEDTLWKFFDTIRSALVRLRSAPRSFLVKRVGPEVNTLNLELPKVLQFYIKNKKLLSDDLTLDNNRKMCSSLPKFVKLFWILEDDNMVSNTQNRFTNAVHSHADYLLFQNSTDPMFVLTFVSAHLRPILEYLIKKQQIQIQMNNSTVHVDHHYLYFSHVLVECLMNLSMGVCKQLPLTCALCALLPWLRQYKLENFACSLLWSLVAKNSCYIRVFNEALQHTAMDNSTIIKEHASAKEFTNSERDELVRNSVQKEYERMQQASSSAPKTSFDVYSACITMARLHIWSEERDAFDLFSEIVTIALLIEQPLIRLDALCSIALNAQMNLMNVPIVNKNYTLHDEIRHLASKTLPHCPPALCALMFIRCLPFIITQPQSFDNIIKSLLKKLDGVEPDEWKVIATALYPFCRSCRLLRIYINNRLNDPAITCAKSSNLKNYFPLAYSKKDVILTNLTHISSMYITELTSDVHFTYMNVIENLSTPSSVTDTNAAETTILSQFSDEILRLFLAAAINHALSSNLHRSEHNYRKLNKALHSIKGVELNALPILHNWMKHESSSEYYSFACHAALLCVESRCWSREAAMIVCNLILSSFDRFRQRAHTMMRSNSNIMRQSSSQISIDVFLTMERRYAMFQHQSPFAALALCRQLYKTEIDNTQHLDCIFWLEKRRLQSVGAKNTLKVLLDNRLTDFIRTDDISYCDCIWRLSKKVIDHLCNHLGSFFKAFVLPDEKTEDHNTFVVSILISFVANSVRLLTEETQLIITHSLSSLLGRSDVGNNIRQAAAYSLGFSTDSESFSVLFDTLKSLTSTSINSVEDIICTLIHAVSYRWVRDIRVRVDDNNLSEFFENLLDNPSQAIANAASVGLARTVTDSDTLLLSVKGNNLHCYQALINATAHLSINTTSEKSVSAVADFIDNHPDLLPIFVFELYDSIQHFSDEIIYEKDIQSLLKYRRPQYVNVAAQLAERMPAAFCSFINESEFGDKLKIALYYTSKQHDFTRRAACLTVLSFFGELTSDLAEMLVHGLLDDPHVQNICYKCVKRIHSVKDKKEIFDKLLSFLKSTSMNTRYVAVKLLFNFSQSSVFLIEDVQQTLLEMIQDPTSDDDLWLIEQQDKSLAENKYYYAGSLKDVVYSLLIKHLIGDASDAIIKQNEMSELYTDFMDSEKSSRLAACGFDNNDDNSEISVPIEDKSSPNKSQTIDEVQDTVQSSSPNKSQTIDEVQDIVQNSSSNENHMKQPDMLIDSAHAKTKKSSFCSLV